MAINFATGTMEESENGLFCITLLNFDSYC